MKILILFIVATITALLTTYLVKKFAIKHSIGAPIQERMVHHGFKPLLGGIGIFIGFVAGIIYSFFIDRSIFFDVFLEFTGLIVASFLIIVVGIYDDVKGLNAKKKIIFSICSSLDCYI